MIAMNEHNFIIEGGQDSLSDLVCLQISNLFFLSNDERKIILEHFFNAIKRTAYCFSHSNNKYYHKNGSIYFSPFHSAQYSIFLYYLSNALSKSNLDSTVLADKIYYLNKALNSVDIFHQVEMPDYFFVDHPVGSVMGRAKYGNGFSFSQNCTVGNNKGVYPAIKENVSMMAGAMILGNCLIEANTIVAADTRIIDTSTPPNSIIFGQSPNLIIKQNK